MGGGEDSLPRGHSKNFAVLKNLLVHLKVEKHTELAELIKSYPSLFRDTA